MVRQESTRDDGSHRLLVVPCVLVVLVMVLMVTACSSVRADGGSDSDARGDDVVSESDDADFESEKAASADGIAEPVVTEDGRMLQPAGHKGIWFETEPTDTLERLVYESQRYVGKPVALEPIGERALLPQWEDMPDPCHPEVLRRMGELGLETVIDDDIGFGYAQCSVASADLLNGSIVFEWGFASDIAEYASVDSLEDRSPSVFGTIHDGKKADMLGCIAFLEEEIGDVVLFSAMSKFSIGYGCDGSILVAQSAVNSLTGGV